MEEYTLLIHAGCSKNKCRVKRYSVVVDVKAIRRFILAVNNLRPSTEHI